MEQDDKIQELFSAYEPPLNDDFAFMKRLERSIDSVEIVRRHNSDRRARSRRAAVVAAIAGFVAGVISTLAIPYITAAVAQIAAACGRAAVVAAMPAVSADHASIAAWFVVALVSVAAALGAYRVAAGRWLDCISNE